MTKEILMNHKGGVVKVLVDDDDYPLLCRHTWFIRSTTFPNKPYAATNLPRVNNRLALLPMHYFIIGRRNVDHINGETLENRKENLRGATQQENGWNTRKRLPRNGGRMPTSIYKGVSKVFGKKLGVHWIVQIKITAKHVKPEKYVRLGPFFSEIEAAKAYNEKIVELRGQWAWLNPIPS